MLVFEIKLKPQEDKSRAYAVLVIENNSSGTWQEEMRRELTSEDAAIPVGLGMNQRFVVDGSVEYTLEHDTEQNVARIVRRKDVETADERGVRQAKEAREVEDRRIADERAKKQADDQARKAAQQAAAPTPVSRPTPHTAPHTPTSKK